MKRSARPGGYARHPLLYGKPAAVLAVLRANPGQCVAYGDLIAAVWPSYKADSATLRLLKQTVYLLRELIADTTAARDAISTSIGYGYAWTGDAETLSAIAEAMSMSAGQSEPIATAGRSDALSGRLLAGDNV